MALGNNNPSTSLFKQAKHHFGVYIDRHGLITIFFVILAGINGLIFWNATMYMQRADTQLDINSRVGNLEGKMELLMQQKQTPEAIVVTAQPTQPAQIPTMNPTL